MFKHYFEQIHSVEVWPIISLSIFFIFFLCLILWVVKADKGYISKMKQLPVDDATLSTPKSENYE
ncbi:cytochrome C oxidase Cbb3 [Fulvivirga maritima]|nr:cytochrome C oxidase Cbb3 [Fulvivirga maritima]